MGHSKNKKGRHKGKIHGQRPNGGQIHQKKPLHDFKSKGQSENVNTKLIELERNRYNKKFYIMLGILIIGALLLYFGIKDEGFEFEGLGIKIKGALVGAVLILVAIIMYFTNSNFKAEIEN